MTRTQEFIEKNRKILTSGPDFYNPDTSLMSIEDYHKAKCRMLVIFPTPHVVKTVSSTAAALNDFVITHCKDTFIDFAYMPENEDIKRYDDWNVPYAIGNITHLDPSHYDIVGFSISVLHEVVSGPAILSTFDRCDKPIPLFWSQRKDMPLGSVPLIYAGGITAACGESMFGKVNVNGNLEQGYMDFVYLGDCGHTHHITNRLIEALSTGKCHRNQSDHDVPGYIHKDLDNFDEVCIVNTMQDFVDSLFDLQEIYQPQAYEVEYNNKNRIVKNIKINPKAQDFVKPYYPFVMEEDLGIGRTIINASGDNTGTTQTQVAEGAHMKGNRIRTEHGLVRVEDLCSKEVGDSECTGTVDTVSGPGKLYHRFTQGVKPVRIFTLKSGIRIGLTDEHPVEQWHIGDTNTEFVRADHLSIGDFFMTKKSHVFGSYPMTPDEAEFLGRMVGDGSYNLYNDSREGHNTSIHKMYLSCAWSEKDYCLDLLMRAGINYKLDETQGRHCRFWIKEIDNKGRSMREFWGFNQFYKQREGKPSVKYIPAPAYKLTEEAMKAFLKGYHDADGCTSTKKGLSKVTFDCCHESIIDDIQQFLLMVGIPTRKHFNEKSRIADEEYGFFDTVNEHWSLQVSSEYFDKFNALGVLKQAQGRNTKSREHLPISDNIRELLYESNLSTEERSRAFAQVRRNSFTKYLADKCGFLYPDVVFDEIVNIEFSEAETYDLSVEKLEKLTANGCSVHNCSAAGSCSFCSEGNYTGGYSEKTSEEIIKESWEAKKYSAGYKYKPYSFNCVAVGTLVPTHKGLQYVENLKEDQCILSVVDWGTHEGIHKSIQPTVSIQMSQGPGLQLTLQHRQTVLTSEGLTEVKADELEPGMWVPQRIGYYSSEKVDVKSINYLLGLWYGDGFYGGNSTYVLVHQNDVELNEIVKSHDYCQRLVRTEGTLNVYLLSKDFTKYCKEVCPKKDSFRLINNLNLQQSLEYIRGLFDADGCGSGGSLKITQKESRINLLKEVQVVLMSVGIRTRISLPTKVTLNGVEHTRRDVYIVGRESRDNFVSIIGASESRKTEYVKTTSTKWSDKDKCIPPIFGVWVYNELKKINAHKGHNVSKFFHGLKGLTVDRFLELFSDYDIEPVQLVKAGIRFAQVLSIKDAGECEVIDVMETTNGRWIANGYVTHNCNYLTDYKGMLAKWIQIYPKVTFINMRMEELGRDVDALKMMKLVGSNRISAPMEGMSPRIQNNLLNKCLSTEALNNFMDEIVHQHLTDIKVGGIFTAYEEDEDFQWQCDFVDRLRKKAAEEGGSFPYRLKCTPLVHYALTPIEYLERKSARKSYNGEHWLTDEWYEKFREHNIHFKVNGFRYSTYLEQSFIDLGRSITDMIYRHFIKEHVKVYSLRSCATDDYIAELKSITDDEGFFGDRDPEHYISPCHRIHIDLMGSYIPRARRLLRHKNNGSVYDNEMDIRCLNTYVGAKTKCFHNCIIKDPLKVYSDVTLDEEGNLHGEFSNLNGCERCQTPQQRVGRLKRPIVQSKNSEDIIATPRIPQVQKIRFVLKRKSDYDLLNPNNTAHTFMTKFLQLSDNLLYSYHSIVNHNMLWQSAPAFKDYVYGYQIVDTMWSKNSIKEVKSLIPEVNKLLKSVQVVSAEEVLREEKLLITDYNTWAFESSLPKEQFDGASHSYKGQIKVEAQVQGFALTETTDSSLMSPVYTQVGGKIVGVFTIPAKYNPIMYLQGYVSQSKKTSEDGIVTSTQFQCILSSRETKAPCRTCSDERAMISLITGKPIPLGKRCLSKALLKQIISKS